VVLIQIKMSSLIYETPTKKKAAPLKGSLGIVISVDVGPQIGMNPKPILGLPDLEY
jgi:hypothetical protein